jgi:hypothetical protein
VTGVLASPIVLAPPNDLLGSSITEGIEDALTMHEATGLGTWAAGSAARLKITKTNFSEARKTFGQWAVGQISKLGAKGEVKLVPVPSKDGLSSASTYRSLKMAEEAFAGTSYVVDGTTYVSSVVDGLRWKKKVSQAHAGGSRSRAVLLPLLETTANLKKADKVILVDELYSTGGSLLACAGRLAATGVEVLGAITCGKTIYDFNTPAFGTVEFELTTELSDWPLA